MKRSLRLFSWLVVALFAPLAPAFAQDSPAPAPAAAPATAAPAPAPAPAAAPTGRPDEGRLLAYTCQGCHGVTGYKNAYPNYHVPKIGGQSAQYLTQALTEYRKGTRKHPTMEAQAQSFSDQDIADLAAYLSSLK
ncbi:c-type cytochrome [Pseudoxanthomonas composti]|uniref:Cytochrome c n=1 Tax=Pseudoxanthomonas composti TaxID=2137479 RepID=A0A4Q1JXQ4_9GAMM|nr:cytochrome c [Pseudoxanthomonas composti]RXR07481.1 cytochrome c [Pseudoxanthomonas composti]